MKKNNGLRRKLAISLLSASVMLPAAGALASPVQAAENTTTSAMDQDKTEKMKELLKQLTPQEQQALKEKAMMDMLTSPDKPLEQVAEDALRETVEPQKYQELKKEVEQSNITLDDALKAKDEIQNNPTPVTPPATPDTPKQPTPTPPVTMPADPEKGTKPTPSFVDIEKVPWAKDAIQTLASEGIITGMSKDKFVPMSQVTRAQYTHLLVQALQLNTKVDGAPYPGFTDVKENDWFALDVAVAAKLGIVSGVSKTKFDPQAPITREQMASMTARAMEAAKLLAQGDDQKKESLTQFKDKSRISSWAQKDIAALVEKKVMTGMNGGVFGPRETANRAQAAVLIHKVYSLAQDAK
ncbi:S-layer homology domain-containing protein [Aneurinibacillus sp. REN35]|uniref:S-layer homology domain-containing protein n=1 Tax=Aneurinibacillus sp. REN35 TaxID=3237286 RepID=UPI003528DF2B